jgi:hypothetical protein
MFTNMNSIVIAIIKSGLVVGLGGLMAIVLVIGPKVSVFKPDRRRWMLKCDKNSKHVFLRRGSKTVGPIT